MRAPAFQFYPQDFLVGTAEMSCEEVGGYMRLLCYQWAKGGLPNDNKKLMQLTGITDPYVLGNVSVKFRLCDDGMLRNDRLVKIKIEQDEFHEQQRQNGRKGGNPAFQVGKKNPYYPQKDNRPLSSGDNPKDKRPHNPPHNPKITPSSSSSSLRYIFTEPTIKEIEEYAKTIDFKLDPEYFIAHYRKTGWKIKGTQIKDWRSCMVTWKKNNFIKNGSDPVQKVVRPSLNDLEGNK